VAPYSVVIGADIKINNRDFIITSFDNDELSWLRDAKRNGNFE